MIRIEILKRIGQIKFSKIKWSKSSDHMHHNIPFTQNSETLPNYIGSNLCFHMPNKKPQHTTEAKLSSDLATYPSLLNVTRL